MVPGRESSGERDGPGGEGGSGGAGKKKKRTLEGYAESASERLEVRGAFGQEKNRKELTRGEEDGTC